MVRALALLLCAMANASAASAAPALKDIDLETERAAIGRFQDVDQRLQDVGWQLVRGNAPFCDKVIPSIGLQLQDTASYGRPDIARAALGLKGSFAGQFRGADRRARLSIGSNRRVHPQSGSDTHRRRCAQ